MRVVNPCMDLRVRSASLLLACVIVLALSVWAQAENGASARVLEFNMPVGINHPDKKVISTDTWINETDTLTLPDGAYVVLVLSDGTVSRFDGPATITLSAGVEDKAMLAKLSTAVISLFFPSEAETEDAYLAMRDIPDVIPASPLKIPQLTYPPPDCHLLASPRRLSWQKVDGVFSYRVSLYDTALLWQKLSITSSVELPVRDSLIRPGNTYLWRVEAEVGGEFLRSKQAMFHVMDNTALEYVAQRLSDIEGTVTDDKLFRLLKLRLYRDLQLKAECFREVEAILKQSPDNYTALVTRAELLEEMELFEEAVQAYKAVVSH